MDKRTNELVSVVKSFSPERKENLHRFVVLKTRSDIERFFFEAITSNDFGHVDH